MTILDRVISWHRRKIAADKCPNCGSQFDRDLITPQAAGSEPDDALPAAVLYTVSCPNSDCSFEELLAAVRARYLGQQDPLQYALQVHNAFLSEAVHLCCEDCGTEIRSIQAELSNASNRWFRCGAFCPACEKKQYFDFGWKVLNPPARFDPAIAARHRLEEIVNAGELFSALGIKGSVP